MKEKLQQLKDWWQGLAHREQMMTAVGSLFVSVFVLYQFVWSPINTSAEKLRHSIIAKSQTVAEMKRLDKLISTHQTRNAEVSGKITPLILLSKVQKLAASAGVSKAIKELKQSGDASITLTFKQVDFDRLTSLLNELVRSYPVSIDQFNAVSGNVPGIVDAQLVIKLQ